MVLAKGIYGPRIVFVHSIFKSDAVDTAFSYLIPTFTQLLFSLGFRRWGSWCAREHNPARDTKIRGIGTSFFPPFVSSILSIFPTSSRSLISPPTHPPFFLTFATSFRESIVFAWYKLSESYSSPYLPFFSTPSSLAWKAKSGEEEGESFRSFPFPEARDLSDRWRQMRLSYERARLRRLFAILTAGDASGAAGVFWIFCLYFCHRRSNCFFFWCLISCWRFHSPSLTQRGLGPQASPFFNPVLCGGEGWRASFQLCELTSSESIWSSVLTHFKHLHWLLSGNGPCN